MAQIISGQWFNTESAGFGQLCGITTRSMEAFERLTALNLQAIRFGLAETQEVVARACAAGNLPEILCLPTLLAPAGAAQALSYSRQFFEILSDLQPDFAAPPVDAVRQRHAAGSVATQSVVLTGAAAKPATSTVPAATEREKKSADRKAIQPMHTE
ncbi:TIGR01841 family phasin [Paraburkholderia xenovorans]|nr:TIGR01841 family phasin [Paraburkholderia xenovorans]